MSKKRTMTESTGPLRLLPAKAGTCPKCATRHSANEAHNAASLYYAMRFRAAYRRDPTWSDAVAHLAPDVQAEWQQVLEDMGLWTDTPNPIAEPLDAEGGA